MYYCNKFNTFESSTSHVLNDRYWHIALILTCRFGASKFIFPTRCSAIKLQAWYDTLDTKWSPSQGTT